MAVVVCLVSIVSTYGAMPGHAEGRHCCESNRPTVANPADITQYGVLEVEYGYNT